MNNLSRAESIAFNADLNRYMRQEDEVAKRETDINDLMDFYLNNEGDFASLNEGYEIVDMGQIMRCLRNLDDACQTKNVARLLIATDAITSALTIIQNRLRDAAEHEVSQRRK